MLRDSLLIGVLGLFSIAIIIGVSIRDESIQPNRFDCRLLIGGWHPDVPTKLAEQCRKGVKNVNSSQTNN